MKGRKREKMERLEVRAGSKGGGKEGRGRRGTGERCACTMLVQIVQ